MVKKTFCMAAAASAALAVILAGGGTPALLATRGADDRTPDRAPGKDGR